MTGRLNRKPPWLPRAAVTVAALLLANATSCRSKQDRSQPPDDRAFELATLQRYADIAFEGYSDATEAADQLVTAVAALLEQPSPARLARARLAWLDARTPYLQTETFRFYDGPIDRVEGFINTWPIDENYVDSDAAANSIASSRTLPPIRTQCTLALVLE